MHHTLLALMLALAPSLGGAPGVAAAGGPLVVVVEPAVFVGMVEVTGDEHGRGVLLSTATEEVVVADNPLAERLMDLEGEVVLVRGRLTESAEAPPTILVREFHVVGRDAAGGPARPGSEAGMRHATQGDEPRSEAQGGPGR